MSLFSTLDVSATALTAQQLRMDVLSQNMANVDTTRTAAGTPYKRKAVLFQERTTPQSFLTALTQARARIGGSFGYFGNNTLGYDTGALGTAYSGAAYNGGGVKVSEIVTDNSDGPKVYDPTHPDADADGYVEKPNVNVVTEMVNLISASRSYEANVTVMNVTKAMINKTFEIGKA